MTNTVDSGQLHKGRAIRLALALLAIPFVAIIIGVIFDSSAAGLYHQWPAILAIPSGQLTNLGKSGWSLISSAGLMVLGLVVGRQAASEKGRKLGQFILLASAYVFATVALSGIISNLIKRLIGRGRPIEFHDLGLLSFHPLAGDYKFESFPSGHATTLGALAMALTLLFPRFRYVFFTLGIVIALMRIFVSAHYPSDVTAGFLFGIWFSLVTAYWFAGRGWLFSASKGIPIRLR
jgi:undecaprenyl-diphosphatase